MKTITKLHFLKSKGFKLKKLTDNSGFWYQKNIKIGDFKGQLIFEEDRFQFMTIQIYSSMIMSSNKKSYEIIWKGDWNKFKQLIKKYK